MNPIARAFLNRFLGDRGERAADRYLRQRGMRILVRRYRTWAGEIDLIARDGDVLVFVEVKTRGSGTPIDAVDLEKQRRVCRAAHHFLKSEGIVDIRHRFDVIAVVWPLTRDTPTIEHFESAFEPVEPRGPDGQ